MRSIANILRLRSLANYLWLFFCVFAVVSFAIVCIHLHLSAFHPVQSDHVWEFHKSISDLTSDAGALVPLPVPLVYSMLESMGKK